MPSLNWGMLAKSQADNETIEQAIARLILVHEQDEESHLGSGESLQSHKASEIIDHLAASIIQDKIKQFEITPNLLAEFGTWRSLAVNFESVDGWTFYTNGGATYSAYLGFVHFVLPASSGSYVRMAGGGMNILTSKDVLFSFDLNFEGANIANGQFSFYGGCGVGDHASGTPSIYFKISNGHTYACHRYLSGGTYVEVAHDISFWPVALTDYVFSIKYFPGEKIEYYINGILKYTQTQNLPAINTSFEPDFSFYFLNNANLAVFCNIITPYIAFKLE